MKSFHLNMPKSRLGKLAATFLGIWVALLAFYCLAELAYLVFPGTLRWLEPILDRF